MLLQEELNNLLEDLESDRIERTRSTDKVQKFCEAICAFSNNFPNHTENSYLIIGVDDKTGEPTGADITESLLLNLAGYKDDGQILPKPSLTVQKYTVNNCDIAIVTVFPSMFPPVRYRGLVHIRVGPRRSIATESEERLLSEKRISSARTFDAQPCLGSSTEDLNKELFKLSYLPNAIDAATLEANHRDLKIQMASLRIYDLKNDCPTNAGIIILGNNAKYYVDGCYVQYVKFAGTGLESDILNQFEIKGDLITMMRQLDDFVKNSVETKLVYTSALQEAIVKEYPYVALRELLNNAIMHRDYESNAPVRFYQFEDRIEISNPGGLYGTATVDNFPYQSDYRNPIIAEAMKVLGYVNKFSIGIEKSKQVLLQNGNAEPVFIYDIPMQFNVTIFKKRI